MQIAIWSGAEIVRRKIKKSVVGILEWDGLELFDGGLVCVRSWIASV